MKTQRIMALALLLAAAAGAQASQKVIIYDPAYRKTISADLTAAGGRVTREFQLLDAVVAVFPDDAKDASIRSVRGVKSVAEDVYRKRIEDAPSEFIQAGQAVKEALSGSAARVPGAGRPEAGEIPWGVARVNAEAAWKGLTGRGVKVAIVDTGADYTHPDLAANYKGGANVMFSTGTAMDDNGHGTHVAGTIAAVRDGRGVAGVAPEAGIYAVKALDWRGYGNDSWVAAGIEWAALNGMNVLNMSLGGDDTEILQQAVLKASQAGVVIICSAGNDSGPVGFPGKYPQSIAISASDSADKLAYFSNRGPEVAFIAPGVDINSTAIGGKYRVMSGTSMAAPHVSGLAALAISAGAKTAKEVRDALRKAAAQLPLSPSEQGAGMIDAAKLLK